MKPLATLSRERGFASSASLKLLAGPVLILLILAMMVLPLPPVALDLLFTFNIALSIMVLLVAMFTTRPLDFAAFPAVLLFTTLLRLSLNVASTRVILMHGHEGSDAAGRVIEAFADFLVGGNFAVGLVVFVILVLINFMVITKGAGRIAEVGARFILDAMPGKQMAIDADLNAGLIDEKTARARRSEITQEADFFGSMDGASKFVRGDAIAGILIMVVNIIGGLIVGVGQHGMSVSDAAHAYTLLTIGDGLVAQIPALVISTAAGVTVSRVRTEQDVGSQLIGQLFTNPRVLLLSAGVLGLLGMVPGMPNLVFLFFTAMLGGLGWYLMRRPEAPEQAEPVANPEGDQALDASWEDVALIDPLGLEVGYRLIPLVDRSQGGELLGRIKGVRKKFAQDLGFLPPVVHIRDDLGLAPQGYRITLNGVEIGTGEAWPGSFLAIDPGGVSGALEGRPTREPAFDLEAVWISAELRDRAQVLGYTVVDASTVIATHLNHLLGRHASELLGRQETQQLLDRVGESAKPLVDEVVPQPLGVGVINRVLQLLLAEEVPIRDMRTILAALAEHASTTTDPLELNALVRIALGRAITQQWFGASTTLEVIGLEFGLEKLLGQALNNGGGLEPGLADVLLAQAQAAIDHQEGRGLAPVMVVAHPLRPLLSRFLRRRLDRLVVMSQAEIPDDRTLKVEVFVGGQ
ncbi:flagellar biosynthesis protein FlhA [Halotalea alkalilenta]|uniref:flagellar biosynthesis protein FlhA n=1 Tax=Halotalea alkalilenta TaxID=376489 RepID=UPI000482C032|nr:flagellar biosynthesis protein FlhA [Halotalea alkalilenta]